jgi:hypothetical protein
MTRGKTIAITGASFLVGIVFAGYTGFDNAGANIAKDMWRSNTDARVAQLERDVKRHEGILQQHDNRIGAAGDAIRNLNKAVKDLRWLDKSNAEAVADIRCAFKVYEDGSASIEHDDYTRRHCWGVVYSGEYKRLVHFSGQFHD